MPIYKGLNKIGTIYKGSAKIDRVYKGSILVYSSAYWLAYSFEPLYNSLIPTTISGKSVQDKLRITKIYGNSEVVNQLVEHGNFDSLTGWSYDGWTATPTTSDNIFTATSTGSTSQLYRSVPKISGHKYIVKFDGKASQNANSLPLNWGAPILTFDLTTSWQTFSIYLSTTPTGNGNLNFAFANGLGSGTVVNLRNVQLIDLTQAFPFDTPTTLDDPRVQKILNEGYIAFNTGEIKSVDIGEFSSEPYNLFDGELEIGTFSSGQPYPSNLFIRSKNFIDVKNGTSYTIKTNITSFSRFYFEQYDENKTYIKETSSSSGVLTLESNCKYIKFLIYGDGTDYTEIPVNQTYVFETRAGDLGYKPHTQPQTLTLHYQGSGVGTSHDSWEITDMEYVFTKKMSEYTFTGSEAWSSSGQGYYTTVLSNLIKNVEDNHNIAQCLISKLMSNTASNIYSGNTDKVFAVDTSGYVWVRDTTNITSTSTAQSYMAGQAIEFELKTPQVIRIPRKHLAIEDISEWSWTRIGTNLFKATVPNAKGTVANNIYISKYMLNTSGWTSSSSLQDKQYSYNEWTTDHDLLIKDTNYDNATDFANANIGVYAFYETADEVADIATEISIEAGGTLTSDSEVITDANTEVKCK